jgi:hypothetical protein
MKQLLKDAGIDQTTWSHQVLMHFCSCKFPATKQMLPKLLALLQRCHASGEMSNQWYFNLRKVIQNHYKTQGNCLFYGDAEEILRGELEYSMEKVTAGKLIVLSLQ